MTEDNEWVPPTTKYEKMIAERLKLLGFTPQDGRQRICGFYPDFVCEATMEIVEVCGPDTTSYDSHRTAVLQRAGWKIYRVPNEVVAARKQWGWGAHYNVSDWGEKVAPGVFRRK
jgi:very-short-patch-repair endonuclease